MCTTREVIQFSAFLTEDLISLARSGESLGLFLLAAGTRIMEAIVLSVENMEGGSVSNYELSDNCSSIFP